MMRPTRIRTLFVAVPLLLFAGAARMDTGESAQKSGGPPGQADPAQPQRPGEHDATARHRFRDVEHWLQVFEDPGRDAWQMPDRVVGALGLENGDLVADIGAGTGYFSVRLARAVAPDGAVFAVDLEAAMVGHIAARSVRESIANLTPVLARPEDPMLPPGRVDLVFICNTFHHIDGRVEYLRRLRRDLTAGGRVAVVDFRKKEIPVGPPAEHKLSRDHVVAEFLEAGYDLAEENTFLPHQYFLIFRSGGIE